MLSAAQAPALHTARQYTCVCQSISANPLKFSPCTSIGLERISCRHCITGAIPPCPVHPLLFVGTHVCNPFSCSPYSEVDPFTHPWEWRPKEVLWHPMRLPSDISRPTQSPSPAPQSASPLPRHLSCHPRHQGHLFGPLQHFPPTPRPSIAKSWPRLVHAAKLFVRPKPKPKPETPLPRDA